MKHDYSTDQFQAFSAGGVRKFLGPGSLPHPNPRVRALLGARAIDVALFFGGGPFLRSSQKWGFFRAVQLQTGANSYAATSTCRLGPIAVLVRALAYGRVFPQADRGIMSPQGASGVSG